MGRSAPTGAIKSWRGEDGFLAVFASEMMEAGRAQCGSVFGLRRIHSRNANRSAAVACWRKTDLIGFAIVKHRLNFCRRRGSAGHVLGEANACWFMRTSSKCEGEQGEGVIHFHGAGFSLCALEGAS